MQLKFSFQLPLLLTSQSSAWIIKKACHSNDDLVCTFQSTLDDIFVRILFFCKFLQICCFILYYITFCIKRHGIVIILFIFCIYHYASNYGLSRLQDIGEETGHSAPPRRRSNSLPIPKIHVSLHCEPVEEKKPKEGPEQNEQSSSDYISG